MSNKTVELTRFQKNALGALIFLLVPFVMVVVADQPVTRLIVGIGALPGAWFLACALHERLTSRSRAPKA